MHPSALAKSDPDLLARINPARDHDLIGVLARAANEDAR
jgi:hypothetical protein